VMTAAHLASEVYQISRHQQRAAAGRGRKECRSFS
jgi:hypothetical protein